MARGDGMNDPRTRKGYRREYPVAVADLEPGGIYEGTSAQRREIIQIDGDLVTYRVVAEAVRGYRIKAPIGTIGTVKDASFRDWVAEEVM